MRRIHIIGRKNSGKTTLVVELVQHLSSLGHRVGTIKHTHHDHELDVPGKDSFRHREAGGAVVGIISPGMQAVFVPRHSQQLDGDLDRDNENERDAKYERMAPMFEDCDLVIVEGDSRTDAPRIEVWREATGEQMIAEGDADIVAIVTDDEATVSCPVWSRSDVPALGAKIVAHLNI